MTFKTCFQAATVANRLLEKARAQLKVSETEKMRALSLAVVFASSLRDCVRVNKLAEWPELRTEAWTKAVVYLGSSPKDFDDLLLVLDCGHKDTARESDASHHLSVKMGLILAMPTMEQVQALHSIKNDYYLQSRAKGMYEKLLKDSQSLEELEEWKALYDNKYANRSCFYTGEPNYVWMKHDYESAVRRLQKLNSE